MSSGPATAGATLRHVGSVLRQVGAPELRRLAVAAAAGAAGELAALALVATATWLLVRAAAQPPIAALGLAIVGVRAFALSRGTLRYLERLIGHDAALAALATLRQRVFAAVEPLGPVRLARLSGGDALARIVDDVDAVQAMLLRCLLPATTAAVVAGAAVTLGGLLLPAAAIATAIGLTLAGAVVPTVTYLRLRRVTADAAAARAELAARCLDLVDGAAELAAYGAGPAARAAADAAAQRSARRQRATDRAESMAGATVLVLQATTTLAVIALGAAAAHAGRPPILVPVLALACFAAFEPMAALPGAARWLVDVTAAAARLVELLQAPPGIAEPAEPRHLGREPVTVELRGARVRYVADRAPALDGVDLRLGPGRRVALVGASGSGKSTVLAALARLVDLDAGHYTLDGIDVRELASAEVRRRLTGAGQDAYVFAASLRDNLALARPGATDDQLLDALRRANLADWVSAGPEGLDTVVGPDGATMSGGQRQRLVLARALLADPEILLLDEPVEGVDPPTAAAILADVLAATVGRTVVLVTHQLAGLDDVDEIVVLDAGRVVQRGRPAELRRVAGRYRELWLAEQVGLSVAARRLVESAAGTDR